MSPDPTPTLTSAGRREIHDAAAAHVGDDRVPGLVALVAHGDDVHVEALGSLGIGRPAVTRDSIFRIASARSPVLTAEAARAALA
jgi:Beta-lactamase